MAILLRVITIIVVSLGAAVTPAAAQSWQYGTRDGSHLASYEGHTRIYYVKEQGSWFFGTTLNGEYEKETAFLKFTKAGGAKVTYAINEDLLEAIPFPEHKSTIVYFPIAQENLEIFQSAGSVVFQFGEKEYLTPLRGSRKAISRAMEGVLLDAAVEDDRQHTIAQADSDLQQAEAASMALAECDALAAHKWDKYSEAAGVDWSALDGQRAVRACRTARELNGDQGRILFQLGRAYDKLDDPATLKLMQYAAWELSYGAAFYHLGTLHEDGLYTPQDIRKAKRSYEEGAALGHVPSRFALGRVLFDEAETRAEKGAAEDLIYLAATADYPYALEKLGILAFRGESKHVSRAKAQEYLAPASDLGMAEATYYLSKLYRDGVGGEKDAELADMLLRRAAAQGSDQAKDALE